ncbi:MAG: CRISPR-associated endonuclease Cas2 [Candidatus Hydrothermae bacterium]|nr:CRISPR-associated endonuclease Cas2 [Candidatus Hydrothermae bacterium]
MKVILVYDIQTEDPDGEGQKILNRVRKVARRFLYHIQKSVFEGELTAGQLARLQQEVRGLIRPELDSVILYVFPDGVQMDRRILGGEDPTTNVI